jgi:opacity protein-like surface antigen
MRKLLLAGTAVVLMATSASAQSSIPRVTGTRNAYGAIVRVGNVTRHYDNNGRLLASGVKHGGVLNIRVGDGTRLKVNYRTRRIYDERGRVVGIAHPSNLR